MGICSYIRKTLHSERGSVTVLAALSLPLLLAFGGMAIDLGSFYSHHSRLQNAAESAALAGGHAFRSSLQNNYTVDEALEEAKDMGDYHAERDMKGINYNIEYDSKVVTLDNGNTATLFKATMTERVPYHFLVPLLKALGKPEYIDLSASGYCTLIDIPGIGGGNPMFNDMFLFDGYKDRWSEWNNVALTLTNNVQNPDNARLDQNRNNLGTFTGAVRAASKTAYDIATARGNIRHDTLLTKYAFEYRADGQITVQQALDAQDAMDRQKYGDLTGLELANKKLDDWYDNDTKPLTTSIAYTEDIDITNYYKDTIVPMQTDPLTKKITERNGLSSSDINNFINESGALNAIYVDTNGVDLNFNAPIRGNKDDDPLYIICRNATNTHINGDMASGRPIVLVLTGVENTEDENGNRQNGGSNIDGANGTFAGIIYAPYGKVFINDNGMKFDGSIVSRGIQTQSNGYYEHSRNFTQSSHGSKPQDVRVVFGGADFW